MSTYQHELRITVRRFDTRAELVRAATLTALLGAYAVLLHLVYQLKIAPAFQYMNLRYRDPDHVGYAIALVLVGVLAALMPRQVRRPSDFILWLLFVMMTIPSILVPQFADILTPAKALELAVVETAIFAGMVVAVRKGPRRAIALNMLRSRRIWIVLAAASLVTYGYMAATSGLNIRLVSLDAVREIRFAYRDQLVTDGPVLGYLIRLQGNVINPTIMARAVYSRRWPLMALAGLGQLLIFSVTGYKLVLLSIPAIVAVALLFRWRPRLHGRNILVGAVATIVAALVADRLLGGLLYTEVFVDRLLLAPGILTAAHVLVFSSLPKAQWAHTFMAPFLDYPYQKSPDFIIGAVFFHSPKTSANANLFADGFHNFGYFGMVIEALFLVVTLWVIDWSAAYLPLAVSCVILLIPTIALVNSSAFSSAFTNGYAYAAVVMACAPRTGWGRRRPAAGKRRGRSPI